MGPQEDASIDVRFSFQSACFVRKRPEVPTAQFRRSTAAPQKRPREQLSCRFDTRRIRFGDLVFLVHDRTIRSAVPMSHVASLVGGMDKQSSGLVIRVAKEDHRPTFYDARKPLELRIGQDLDVNDGNPTRPENPRRQP